MKIVAIASIILDLEVCCFGTLSRFTKDGHKVSIIVAGESIDRSRPNIQAAKESSKNMGASQVFLTYTFDYSKVTQYNADLIRSFIKKVEPALVITSFWKSSNRKRQILAKTSLIACRGIKNILMYEMGNKDSCFEPNIHFVLSDEDISLKLSCLAAYDRKKLEEFEIDKTVELFESHRMVLVDEHEIS